MSTRPAMLRLGLCCLLAGCSIRVTASSDAALDGAPAADGDADGISDHWEGRGVAADADLDTVPDWRDPDSDNDGIPDAVEGRAGEDGRPADADGDGIFDFRDRDSDGDGIDDADAGTEDPDDDGIGNYADDDDDGDGVSDREEVGDDPRRPRDTDRDGTPDHLDLDSDGDAIPDADEALPRDTDRDGTPDRLDLDTDGDEIADAEERGAGERPRDTDGDGVPDFRDLDADDDGVLDRDELALGTDPALADTDGDGATDMIEIAACAGRVECARDPVTPDAGPLARGDVVITLPYEADPVPDRLALRETARLQALDVYFLGETEVAREYGGFLFLHERALGAARIEELRALVPDLRTGAGVYEDFPGFSSRGFWSFFPDPVPFRHLQDIDSSTEVVTPDHLGSVIAAGPGNGLYPAIWAMATGDTLPGMVDMPYSRAESGGCPDGRVYGWPCFRVGALPLVVVTAQFAKMNGPPGGDIPYSPYDEALVGGPVPSYSDAVLALRSRGIRVAGIVNSPEARAHLEALARDTRTFGSTGDPLVVDWPEGLRFANGGPEGSLVTGIVSELVAATRFDVAASLVDASGDAVDARAFVSRIELRSGDDCPTLDLADRDGDGMADTALGLGSGDEICLDVVAARNTTVPARNGPLVFRATLELSGDRIARLSARRTIHFLVPRSLGGPR